MSPARNTPGHTATLRRLIHALCTARLRAPSIRHVERRAVCSGWISRTPPQRNPKNSVASLDFQDGIYTLRCLIPAESGASNQSGRWNLERATGIEPARRGGPPPGFEILCATTPPCPLGHYAVVSASIYEVARYGTNNAGNFRLLECVSPGANAT